MTKLGTCGYDACHAMDILLNRSATAEDKACIVPITTSMLTYGVRDSVNLVLVTRLRMGVNNIFGSGGPKLLYFT